MFRLRTPQHPSKVVVELPTGLPNFLWLLDANKGREEEEALPRWGRTAAGFQEGKEIVICDLMAKLEVTKELGYQVRMKVST